MARLRRVRKRWLAAGAVLLAVSVTLAVSWQGVQRYTGTLAPPQFYRAAGVGQLPHDPAALGVAHNAGNTLRTASVAARHGADVIEVDVVSVGGTVVAGRAQPLSWLRQLVFFGPTLHELWQRAAPENVVLLDLKRHDDALVDQVEDFLAPRAGSRTVLISSTSVAVLQRLNRQLPRVETLLTLAWPADVARLRAQPALRQTIDGVSVFHGLVNPGLVGWLHQAGLLVLAWTVDDARTAASLLRDGVDGITTNNLAILQKLAGSHRPWAKRPFQG